MFDLSSELAHLMTWAWMLALLNIILIDIVMSWDNAIVIWMATKNLEWAQRKKAILIWIILATVFRIVFASIAVILLQLVWIKLIWWLLLLYVVWKFYLEIRWVKSHEEKIKSWKAPNWLMSAIWLILIADVTMSLDNVLAVAWVAKESVLVLWIWLLVSIILMAIASNFIAKKLEQYPQIQWVWLIVILFVSMWMILEWSHEIQEITHLKYSLLPFIWFIIWMLAIIFHKKYLTPLKEEALANWFSKNYLQVVIFNIVFICILLFFWDSVKQYLFWHKEILIWFISIIAFVILEIIFMIIDKKKSKI